MTAKSFEEGATGVDSYCRLPGSSIIPRMLSSAMSHLRKTRRTRSRLGSHISSHQHYPLGCREEETQQPPTRSLTPSYYSDSQAQASSSGTHPRLFTKWSVRIRLVEVEPYHSVFSRQSTDELHRPTPSEELWEHVNVRRPSHKASVRQLPIQEDGYYACTSDNYFTTHESSVPQSMEPDSADYNEQLPGYNVDAAPPQYSCSTDHGILE
jgi:hypothetical protein